MITLGYLTFITRHGYIVFIVIRIFKVYSHSNFHICNTLLTIVTSCVFHPPFHHLENNEGNLAICNMSGHGEYYAKLSNSHNKRQIL